MDLPVAMLPVRPRRSIGGVGADEVGALGEGSWV